MKLVLLFTLVVVGIVQASEEKIKLFKELYCSDNPEKHVKLQECVDLLPAQVKAVKLQCKEEAAPGVSDPEELRKTICDESTGVGAKIHSCIEEKKAEKESSLPEDAKEQIAKALECMTSIQ